MKKSKRVTLRHELWIGLARVEQTRDGIFDNADQAFTNAIGKASTRSDFRGKVIESLNQLELKLLRLENAETLNDRLAKYSIAPELVKIAEEAEVTGRVGFGTFHTFNASKPG